MARAEGGSSARDRILTIATALFAERGFGSVSVADIAQASGISTGLIYYHFADKQALYDTSIRESVHLLEEVAVHALSDDVGPAERLRRFATEYVRLLDQHADLMRVLIRSVSDLHGQTPRLVIMRSAAIIGRIEAVIAEGVEAGEFRTQDSRLAALALFALVSTPITVRALETPLGEREALTPEMQAAFMVDLFLKGIAPC
ncbi:MAG TPA: TetR/AcrR family transcriptional regulator [Coriobacteriia bacterium]|nr:TetR/AcrR family transcriptional regulator [Coriobacteriia bacterium]